MFIQYINTLIDNIPKNHSLFNDVNICYDNKNERKMKEISLDIVLDGGIFNGSYLIGGLLFLNECEKRKTVKIERISGCSIGSIAGLLYFIGELELITSLYKDIFDDFRKNYTLNKLFSIKHLLLSKMPENICDILNNRFFVTYYDIRKNNKITRSSYKNKNDIIETIFKSCFVPYLINGKMLYREKYIDGITPYIFDVKNDKIRRKVLYMDLFGFDKLSYMINVKNENTNTHRILSGILDIHNFFIKKTNTPMCSFVNDWGLYCKFHNICKKLFEYIIIKIIILFAYMHKFTKEDTTYKLNSRVIFIFIRNITITIYKTFMDIYCF